MSAVFSPTGALSRARRTRAQSHPIQGGNSSLSANDRIRNEQVRVEMQTFLRALDSYPDYFARNPHLTFEQYLRSHAAISSYNDPATAGWLVAQSRSSVDIPPSARNDRSHATQCSSPIPAA